MQKSWFWHRTVSTRRLIISPIKLYAPNGLLSLEGPCVNRSIGNKRINILQGNWTSSTTHTLLFLLSDRRSAYQPVALNIVTVMIGVSLVALLVKTQVQFISPEYPLEKDMATHSSLLAWRLPWTEEPGRLQSVGSQRVVHDCVTNFQFFHNRIKYYVI